MTTTTEEHPTVSESAAEAQARVIGPLLDRIREPRERAVACQRRCGRSTWNVSALCDRCAPPLRVVS